MRNVRVVAAGALTAGVLASLVVAANTTVNTATATTAATTATHGGAHSAPTPPGTPATGYSAAPQAVAPPAPQAAAPQAAASPAPQAVAPPVPAGPEPAGPAPDPRSGSTQAGAHRAFPPAAAQPVPAPVRLVIPALGVDAAIVAIATDAAGALVPPTSTAIVGWFAAGPAPGATGPALLAGHVDSRAGPGVFFRLRDLRAGDRVDVVRADGSTASFTVTGHVESAKSAFPTDLVYAPTPGPELRLVTCGGAFDHAARSYLDNIIVQALPTSGAGWTLY